ncbi:PREDICTED: uncharacterized protein LOC108540684 isoform X2 [Rhinopithecus bieti]|uniref:uncharacterized protein LOC108540684 isoform X2 n=1 Tax=Rhinopithecus bieti TaxID=61621 RepID=UPI00083C0F22|nr:PREDICTED: uncharacterized protein LOC108540684 isoform X2 [Rhinopithecus bieti]
MFSPGNTPALEKGLSSQLHLQTTEEPQGQTKPIQASCLAQFKLLSALEAAFQAVQHLARTFSEYCSAQVRVFHPWNTLPRVPLEGNEFVKGTVAGAGMSGFRLAAFLQLQDGFSKGRMQCHSSKRI